MNGSTSSNDYILPVAPGTLLASIVILPIASLVAFSANAHVCFLLRKRSDLRKVPHYLFGSLAVNGIFSSLLNLPSRLALTVIRLWDIPVSVELACYVLVPSGFVCNLINAVTLSLMAIDRQDCVLRPFNRRMSRDNIAKVIAFLWIGTLALSSPIIFKSVSQQQFAGCDIIPRVSKAQDFTFVYFIILSNFSNMASVLITVVTALRIIKGLRSSSLPESNSHHRQQENKLMWFTYKICIVFLVCKLPIFVYFPVAIFLGNADYIPPNIFLIALLITNVPYIVNPFLFRNMLRGLSNIHDP